MAEKKLPDVICRAGDREFRLYRYYDQSLGLELVNYPNFQEHPLYTAEGRPFALAVQESCVYGRDDRDAQDRDPGDCGGCTWFYRQETYSPIGVCMCEAHKRQPDESESILSEDDLLFVAAAGLGQEDWPIVTPGQVCLYGLPSKVCFAENPLLRCDYLTLVDGVGYCKYTNN